MRKAKIGLFEKDSLIEELAREFYKLQGCNFPEGKRMQESTHPAERFCVAAAVIAVERMTTYG